MRDEEFRKKELMRRERLMYSFLNITPNEKFKEYYVSHRFWCPVFRKRPENSEGQK